MFALKLSGKQILLKPLFKTIYLEYFSFQDNFFYEDISFMNMTPFVLEQTYVKNMF